MRTTVQSVAERHSGTTKTTIERKWSLGTEFKTGDKVIVREFTGTVDYASTGDNRINIIPDLPDWGTSRVCAPTVKVEKVAPPAPEPGTIIQFEDTGTTYVVQRDGKLLRVFSDGHTEGYYTWRAQSSDFGLRPRPFKTATFN